MGVCHRHEKHMTKKMSYNMMLVIYFVCLEQFHLCGIIRSMGMAGEKVAVLDHGKSNVKLFVCSKFGNVLDSRSTPNVSLDGANLRYTCLKGLNE